MLKITQNMDDSIPTMKMEGEFISESVGGFKSKLQELADLNVVPIILDMSEVKFIDSTGVGAILEAVHTYKETDTPIKISYVSPFVRRVLSYFMKKENQELACRCMEFSKKLEPASEITV